MRGRTAAITFAVLLMALSGAAVSAATAPNGEWHRLNPGPVDVREHERLQCVETSTRWTCSYDKLPGTGLHYDGTVGTFQGKNITTSWTCPDWFASRICRNVIAVYEGTATYVSDGGGRSRYTEDYIVTEISGRSVLYQYFVGQFVCPWFRTFDEALAANPNAKSDCVFAP
jgi:hypothetical protein